MLRSITVRSLDCVMTTNIRSTTPVSTLVPTSYIHECVQYENYTKQLTVCSTLEIRSSSIITSPDETNPPSSTTTNISFRWREIKLRDTSAACVSRGLPGTEKEERLAPAESELQLEPPCRIRADVFLGLIFFSVVVIAPHETVIKQTGISTRWLFHIKPPFQRYSSAFYTHQTDMIPGVNISHQTAPKK